MKILYSGSELHKKIKKAAADSELSMIEVTELLIKAGLKMVKEGKLNLTK